MAGASGNHEQIVDQRLGDEAVRRRLNDGDQRVEAAVPEPGGIVRAARRLYLDADRRVLRQEARDCSGDEPGQRRCIGTDPDRALVAAAEDRQFVEGGLQLCQRQAEAGSKAPTDRWSEGCEMPRVTAPAA
jgi:hypothetical protein